MPVWRANAGTAETVFGNRKAIPDNTRKSTVILDKVVVIMRGSPLINI